MLKKNSGRHKTIQSLIQAKDLKRLEKTTNVQQSLEKTSLVYRFYCKTPKTPEIMANCNPVVPVMDWTEDAELHKRYVEWKEEIELELGSFLSNRSICVKSNYVLGWAGKPAKDVYQNQSSNMNG